MARRKQNDVTENPLYHDTWKLIQKYRNVVWNMEETAFPEWLSGRKIDIKVISDF